MEPNIFEAGPDAIQDAILEQVTWMFSDVDEIGTSDVSACVKSVFASLGYDADRATDHDYNMIRGATYQRLSRLNQSSWDRATV